ncbi:MAG: hypothetical protein V7K14_03765 [Nostoc sp.]|uniref:hypothetical protein n=1 Tax=Nostoc sp. TaxID=1180 RepID=UPI002FFA16CA
MSYAYVLDEELNAIAVDDQGLEEYIKRNGNPVKHIAFNYVEDVLISTIFLSANCQWNPDKPPLFFETEVFGGELDRMQTRYSTYEQAVAGHRAIVDLVLSQSLIPA